MTHTKPCSEEQSNTNNVTADGNGDAANANAQPGHRDQRPTTSPRAGLIDDLFNNPESLLDTVLELIQKFWLQVRRIASIVMVELGGYEIFDMLALWCVRNPHTALCLLAASLVIFMPFLIIFGFGIFTMIMTFTGILVLEGTLLTLISMLFFACLGGLAVIVALFAVVSVAAYFGFNHVYGYYGGMERHRETVSHYVNKQRNTTNSSQSANPAVSREGTTPVIQHSSNVSTSQN